MTIEAPDPAPEHDEPPRPGRWGRVVAFGKDYAPLIDGGLKSLLIVAVLLGGYEYLSRQQSARVEKSLELVDEWKDAGHREAWQRINDLLWPVYSQSAEAIQAVGTDADARALLYGNLGDAVTGRDDDFASAADRDVDQVFYFFERAALCSNERICDYDVIETFLGEEARTFWLYFSRYAERRQAVGYAGYGTWTARLARGDIRRSWLGLI